MPLTKIQLRPGINKENTNYGNEGGYFNCDKVRFQSGVPEKIGGWANQSTGTFKGVARSLFSWSTYSSEDLLAVGTNQAYYIEKGGVYNDITPVRTTVTLGADPFATVSGSNVITVTAAAHAATASTYISISGASAVAGLTISGVYEIISTPDGNTFIILASGNANATTTGGGAAVSVVYKINAGTNSTTVYGGWGSGTWGSGGWGIGTGTVNSPIQPWSQCTSGDNVIFSPRSGTIYYWNKDTSTWAIGTTLATAANAVTSTTKAATFGGVTSTITIPDSLNVVAGSVVTGANISAGTYVTTSYTGGTSVPLSAPTTGVSSGNYTFSYSGRNVPNNTRYVMSSDVSEFVIVLGANPYDPNDFASTFDPMLVRWSDQQNPYEWTPLTTNQSGEQHLNNGSFLVCGKATRQESLLWSNTALYSMQYIGPPFVWNFTMLMDNITIISPNAAIIEGNVTYWMGKDKFYTYNGQVTTLPCTLQKYIFDDLNMSATDQIVSGSNQKFSEVWWFYPSAGSLINNKYVIFNYDEGIWYYGDMIRTGWLSTALREYPLGAFSIQTSYLSVAINSVTTTLTLIDGTSYPSSGTITIDSEQITYTGISGNTITGCTRGANASTAASHTIYSTVTYTIPNQILNHELGVDDQSSGISTPIEAYLESSDVDIGDGDHFAFIWRIVPDISFDGSTTTNPRVILTLKPRDGSGANYITGADTPTVVRTSTYPVEQFTNEVFTRVRGRQVSFRIESTQTGVAWQAGAMRLDIRPDGRR